MSFKNIVTDAYVCKLPSLSSIVISGEQAHSYLQGQVTVNTELLNDKQALLACHCDFKGKMWNANYLIEHTDGLEYLVKTSASEACLNELKKYGVFSKVDISKANESSEFLGLGGEQAKSNLLALFPDLQDNHLATTNNQHGWVLTLKSDKGTRYLCKLNTLQEHGDVLYQSLTIYDESLWDTLDIIDGIAPIFAQTSNEFVPQMFNMQATKAIDFNKGCYMGQEVVARTKYLGKNKRATYLLISDDELSDEIASSAGDLLEKPAGENWRRGGTIVHSSRFKNRLYVLAVLSNDTEVNDKLRLKDYPHVSLTVSQLPYSIEAE